MKTSNQERSKNWDLDTNLSNQSNQISFMPQSQVMDSQDRANLLHLMALSSLFKMMAISGHKETGPVRTGYFSVDMSTALNAAFAISAALFRRHLTGEGQRIDVSMLDSATMMQAPQISNYLVSGEIPHLIGNQSPTKQPTCNVFETKNGFVQVIALRETQIQSLLKAIGKESIYEQYNEPELRVKNTDVFLEFLLPTFASETTEHWVTLLENSGVPVAAIRNLDK